MLKHLKEMDRQSTSSPVTSPAAVIKAEAKPIEDAAVAGKTTATATQDEAAVKKRRTLKD